MNPTKRLMKASLNRMGLNVTRTPRGLSSPTRLEQLYRKYKGNTMLGRAEYMRNLALAATVTAPGCVIECGVWKGGSSAGMGEVLGPDREYFCSIVFRVTSIHSRSTAPLHLPGRLTRMDPGTSTTLS
jgi:hypothetical protein